MRTLAVSSVLLIALLFSDAWAISIVLKNGSVLEGVASYERKGGKYLIDVSGGIIEMPEAEVVRIIEDGTPPKKAEKKEKEETTAPSPDFDKGRKSKVEDLRQKLADIDKRLSEIKKAEDKAAAFYKEYDEVRLRIEVLFQRGRQAALTAGANIARWFEFLNPQERQWVQVNTLRKDQLEKEKKDVDEELAPYLTEKEELLKERKDTEDELSSLE